MGNWWSEHPDLEGVARHGRRELEEEATAAEADSDLLRRRRRSLVDVCFEWMSSGDNVTIGLPSDQFEGQLKAAINDLVVLSTRTVEISINLNAVCFVRSNQRAAFSGTSGERTVSSFRAQLGLFEVEGTPVRLVGKEAFDVTGVITASTDDHVMLRDNSGVEWALHRDRITHALIATRE